jgi:hypothetical protein
MCYRGGCEAKSLTGQETLKPRLKKTQECCSRGLSCNDLETSNYREGRTSWKAYWFILLSCIFPEMVETINPHSGVLWNRVVGWTPSQVVGQEVLVLGCILRD